ncbi:MAG: hypothetical protein ACYDFU_08760 [Nitrospirota bacterium]
MITMVTPSQRARIRELEEYLGWTQTPGRLRGFILRRTGSERVLTYDQAERVIEGLTELAQEKESPPEKGKGQG